MVKPVLLYTHTLTKQELKMKKTLFVALMVIAGFAQAQESCTNVVAEVSKAVSANLKDPSSTMIRNLKFYQYKDNKGQDAFMAVGEVNGKNSYGGYAGFTPFGIHVMKFPEGKMFAYMPVIANTSVNVAVVEKIFVSNIRSATLVCSQ
jgi:hypothetical protein